MMARVRVVIVAVIALVLVTPVLMPLVTGHRLIVVDGGSMSPTFQIGDVLVTAAPTGDDLQLGRIVVVGESGTLYTHRVREVERSGAGGARARLQGDANSVPDPGWVVQHDVYAIYETHLGGVPAALARGVITPPGTLVLLAIAVALLLIGARGAVPRPARRSRRSLRRHDPREAPAP
jgi:signal peptidase I